jgi:PAS domain S-box-containing protein
MTAYDLKNIDANDLLLLRMMDEVEGYAIILLDKDGFIKTWNKGAEKIKGYTAKEIIGQHFSIFYTLQDREKLVPEAILADAAAKGQFYTENWRLRKDGSEFWGSVTIKTIRNEQGRLEGFAKITRDLTERKLTENIIHRQLTELDQKNKELEQFVYIASHDLQEPLLTVNNFIELIQTEYENRLDDDAKLYFRFMSQATLRMKNLIKGLLDYSRIGREKTVSRVDCNHLLGTVLKDMSATISECGALVTSTRLPVIHGYKTELRQLFQNLISNALKFRKSGVTPLIDICADRIGQNWRFSVKDNGIGIDPLHQEKIFKIFQRLHTRDLYEGNGIGLANCKKIVEMHGGTIYVVSQSGAGSIFYFNIPSP